jgi:O-antigen/teichoic acid export membrane protein
VNRASAARSVKWSVVENGGIAAVAFSSLVVYAHFLSVSDFGLFSIVWAVIELMMALVGMLFHDALVQRRDIRELHYDTAFTATLGLSAMLAALCWLLGPVLASQTGAADAGPLLLWMSLCLPLTAVSATLVARRRRELHFRTVALRAVAARAAGAAIGIPLVVLGFSVWGLVAQHVLMALFGSLLLWVHCADRPRLRFGMSEFRELIGFALASVSALMLHLCIKRAFIVVSGVMLGTHAAGLLNLSFRAVDTLWSLAASTVSRIALPVLSLVRIDEGRFRRALGSASGFACVTLYGGFVLLGATSREVVELLFGPQWVEISPYVTLLALQVLAQARRPLFAPVLTALGRPREVLVCQAAELAFVAGMIALWGLPSVAWAIGIWLGREAVGSALELWMVGRATRIGMRELLGSIWVPLVGALALFSTVWICRELLGDSLGTVARLALLAPAGALAYFACVALLERRLLVELLEFVRSAFRHRHDGRHATRSEAAP